MELQRNTWEMKMHILDLKSDILTILLTITPTSVVTDAEFASESANFSTVRLNPNPRIFGARK